MTTEQTALRFVHGANAAKFHKTALLTVFMEFSHGYNACFPRRGAPRLGKVQGFCANRYKTLAPEQSQVALKAAAFKAFGFVQYAL